MCDADGDRAAAATTVTQTKWLLEDLASPLAKRPIAKRPIKEITSAEILELPQKIEKSGPPRLRPALG